MLSKYFTVYVQKYKYSKVARSVGATFLLLAIIALWFIVQKRSQNGNKKYNSSFKNIILPCVFRLPISLMIIIL